MWRQEQLAAKFHLTEAERAELHQSFAAWLEQHGAELVELDEIVGYHLEQAWRYRTELGSPDRPTTGAMSSQACSDHCSASAGSSLPTTNRCGGTLRMT